MFTICNFIYFILCIFVKFFKKREIFINYLVSIYIKKYIIYNNKLFSLL